MRNGCARLIAVVTLATACETGELPPAPGLPSGASRDPAASFPRFLDLHAQVIRRTCSPNPGVCHASSNVPDLSTAAGMLLAIDMPCNLEPPEPRSGWDECERTPDRLLAESFESEIAWKERIDTGIWRFELRDPPDLDIDGNVVIEDASGHVVLALGDGAGEVPALVAKIAAGSRTGTVSIELDDPFEEQFIRYEYDRYLFSAVAGDPNRNGIFGAERADSLHAHVIAPGSLERSYLWRRITGTAPGTRMPLANQPLTNAEYLALACWIEGLARTSTATTLDPIDYASCEYAKHPVAWALE